MSGSGIWQPGLTLAELEKRAILEAFQFYHWHRASTASALGISLRTLGNKIAEFKKQGIEIPHSMFTEEELEEQNSSAKKAKHA